MADPSVTITFKTKGVAEATRDSEKLGKTLEKTGKEAENAGKGADKFASSWTRVKDVMTGIIGADIFSSALSGIKGFVQSSFDAAASFEQQLSNIKALTGASEDQVKTIQELSMKLGKETAFSALEAAQGIEELLKAGVSLEAVIDGGIKGALDLAAAGGIEVAAAAEIASTALNAFKDDNLTVSAAADILAGAANSSATSVDQLRLSLSMSSVVAAGLGISFRDTNTALALFAQNGLKGSDAGTSLKTMLLNLQPTTADQVEAFYDLGLINGEVVRKTDGTIDTIKVLSNEFFDATGKVKSLGEISKLLNDKLKGLTSQQRLLALETMFGTDAIRAANILFKEGEEGVTKMQEAMSKVKATDVAAERMNNFKGVMDNFNSTMETLQITLGEKFLPGLTDGIREATSVLNGFMDNSVTPLEIALGTGLVLAATLAGRALITSLVGAIAGAGGVTAAFGSMLAFLGPAGLFVLGAGAMILALETNFLGLGSFVRDLFARIQQGVQDTLLALDRLMGTQYTKQMPAAVFDPNVGAQYKTFKASGGVIPGNSFSGDNVQLNANSGEMVLTKQDQSTLLALIRGMGRPNQTINANFSGGSRSRGQEVNLLSQLLMHG